jgi:cell division protease FtsH
MINLKKRKKAIKIAIISFIGLFIWVTLLIQGNQSTEPKITFEDMSYNEFMQKVEEGGIIEYVKYRHMAPEFQAKIGDVYYIVQSPQDGGFKRFLLEKDIEIKRLNTSSVGSIVFELFVSIVPITILIIFLLRISKGKGLVKKSTATIPVTNSRHNFFSVAGHNETKRDLMPLVKFLKNPKECSKLGGRLPKGIILYGPPGTGKTLLAKAMAGEANVPFYNASASEFVEMYVGVGASRVRELFKKARETAPSVIFIDELEALAKSTSIDNHSEKEQTLKQFLVELDGFSSTSGILVIGATNNLESLDQTFIRSGRFDRHIAVGLPDVSDRLEILKIHAMNKKLSPDVSLENIAKSTTGFSGADLENLLNESALIATLEDKDEIKEEDIKSALYKILMKGHMKDNSKVNQKEIEIKAYHEAGHTIVAKLIANRNVNSVTVIPSTSGSGGVTFIESRDTGMLSRKDLVNEIKIAYAGRAAEEILFGNSDDVTTGAYSDIKMATEKIMAMITSCGMSDYGLLNLSMILEKGNEKIIEEAKKISKVAYDETVEFLQDNIDLLKEMSEELMKKETLQEDDINRIIEHIRKSNNFHFTYKIPS